MLEDEKIIELFLERDESAISETAQRFGAYCRKISLNILGNYEDSAECENDTYSALWKLIPPNRPENLKAYIGRLARNISLSRYDYNNAKKRNSSFDAVLSELEECISSDENVEKRYEQGEISEAISRFLKNEKRENRIIFIRRYWYADSVSDIAKRYSLSEGKVKSCLFRTRKKLKEYLEKERLL